jgi:hypothetical protein
VPKDKRAGALRLQVLEWSPFSSPDMLFDITDGPVGAWIWDADHLREALAAANIDSRRARPVPETALRPPLADGIRLVRCLDGIEGQLWSKSLLTNSRWWPTPPDEVAWVRFQRASGIAAADIASRPPEVEDLPWLNRPWPRSGTFLTVAKPSNAQLAAAIAVVALTWTSYQIGQVLRVGREIDEAVKVAAAAGSTARPLLEARTRTLAATEQARTLLSLDPYENQLTLMARVTERLPRNGTTFADWSFRAGDLTFMLVNQAQPIDVPFLVRAIEGTPGFDRVQADPGADGKSVNFRLKVRPR